MGMENFLEESDVMSVVQGSSGDWWYVPKVAYFEGLVRVAIHEVSADNWEIHYCAQGFKSAMASPGASDVELELNSMIYGGTGLNEEAEGDALALKGWSVKSKWQGNFREALKRCVAIVQGKIGEAAGIDVSTNKIVVHYKKNGDIRYCETQGSNYIKFYRDKAICINTNKYPMLHSSDSTWSKESIDDDIKKLEKLNVSKKNELIKQFMINSLLATRKTAKHEDPDSLRALLRKIKNETS